MMLQCSIELPPVNVNFAINALDYRGAAHETCRSPGALWVRFTTILIRLNSGPVIVDNANRSIGLAALTADRPRQPAARLLFRPHSASSQAKSTRGFSASPGPNGAETSTLISLNILASFCQNHNFTASYD